ncbi:TraB/GumN family protein [Sphingosinicella sp. CPCC 101087]|uniref:TraB/GumN family protein n=1 Tax=Sphingosinicella sp. CPCC 101087 TaxID=2497754 RepID=UPI00101B7509|nr:TraB/GumN family protein [Sphingosinicella sp. CPCC 101087]
MKKLFLAAALAFIPAAAFCWTPPEPPSPATAPADAKSDMPSPKAPASASATLPDADPAIWAVRDEDTTIYLFGTFHLLDARPWFNDEVKAAFDSSDELVLEAILPDNPAELQPLILRYAIDPEGRKLSERLTPDQNAALAEAVSGLGAPVAVFDMLEPWFVSMTLAAVISQRVGITAEHGVESVLMRAARERDIPISELEGMEWQIRLFDSMPEEEQLAQLRQTLDSFHSLDETLAPMLTAWSSGDVEALHDQLTAHGEQDPDLQRLLFTDRNRTWARWIRERMARPGTVFVAVGAGHLAGSDSVQAVLRENGIVAERVPHIEKPGTTAD